MRVERLDNLETGGLHRLVDLGVVDDRRKAVALLDAKLDVVVLLVLLFVPVALVLLSFQTSPYIRVVFVGHAPLVHTKEAARLESLVDFAEASRLVGRVTGCLDRECGIVRARRDLERHKVGQDERAQVANAVLLIDAAGTLDLVVVVVDTGDACLRELGNVAHGTADSAADVERLQTNYLLIGEASIIPSCQA